MRSLSAQTMMLLPGLLLLLLHNNNVCAQVEHQLINRLLKDYNPQGRPIRSLNEVVEVTISYVPRQLAGVDPSTNLLRIQTELYLEWLDPILMWNNTREGTLQYIQLLCTVFSMIQVIYYTHFRDR